MPAPQTLEKLGYCIHERVLSAEECGVLVHSAAAAGRRSRAGARHLMNNAAVAALATDCRLMRITGAALGPEAVPFRATLFEKSTATNWLIGWHQDTALPLAARFESPEWGPWSCKQEMHYSHAPAWALSRILALRLHLDKSGPENGPLRVLPGSHRYGVLTDKQVLEIAATNPSVECLVPCGGILAMRPLLIHASSKARIAAPRRVLHIEYADSLTLAPGIRLALA